MRIALLGLVVACSGGSGHPTDATSDVVIPAGCGDGIKDGAEQCDKADLGGATCATAAAPGWVGVVSCTASCQFNVAGCNPPATTWNTLTDAGKWSTFDVSTLFPGAKGFSSSAFDGRYLYLVPNSNGAADGIVTRYDTQGGFGSSGSWSTFDVSTVNASAKGFQGAAFDGRNVYFVPYNNGAYDGVIARYDTQSAGGFGGSAAWSTFDIATLDPNARGFVRAAFDGRYLYLAPHYNGAYHGIAVRYDTQADFTQASSWSTFDVSTVNAAAKGFLGAVFDGHYVYLIPYYDGAAYDGLVMRYDPQAAGGFAAAASWTGFNVAGVNGNAVGFYAGTFDGRYLYLGQYYDGAATMPNYGGFTARYDTQANFASAASWQVFDIATVNANARGFIGATFDGRYVYYSPYYNGGYDGIVVRHDTQGAGFTAGASWSTFDVSTINGGARGYEGAAFDGKYMYLVPTTNGPITMPVPHGIVARFDTKSPPWLRIGWNGSFD